MRSLEQIIHDNGNDNTPALDTHNLTGRVCICPEDGPINDECRVIGDHRNGIPEGVEPDWVGFLNDSDITDEEYEEAFLRDDDDYEPGTAYFGWIDCE